MSRQIKYYTSAIFYGLTMPMVVVDAVQFRGPWFVMGVFFTGTVAIIYAGWQLKGISDDYWKKYQEEQK